MTRVLVPMMFIGIMVVFCSVYNFPLTEITAFTFAVASLLKVVGYFFLKKEKTAVDSAKGNNCYLNN